MVTTTKQLAEAYTEVVEDVRKLFKAGWTLEEVQEAKERLSIQFIVAETDLDQIIKLVQKESKKVKENKMENATKGTVKIGAPAAGGHKAPAPKTAAPKKAAPKVDRVNPKEGEKWVIVNYKGEGMGFIALQGEVKGNDVDIRWSPRRRYFSEQKKHIVRDATAAEIAAKQKGESIKLELKK